MRWNAATKSRSQSMLIWQIVDGGRGAGPRVDCLEIDDYGGVKSPDGNVAAVVKSSDGMSRGDKCRRRSSSSLSSSDQSELEDV